MWTIPLFDLDYTDEEKQAVNEVLESKWLSSGKKTLEFEDEFAKYLGNDVYAVALSSATAALHIGLMLANISEGDEVIAPGLTFVADANVITMLKAKPVFYDVNSLYNWNCDIQDIKSKVTEKTKAIIIVHFAGYPTENIEELTLFCKEKNIFLIEDVAHAIGASYDNKKCGTFGDISCFSFFSNKNLSTGEGGMLATKNLNHYQVAKLYRSHGMTSMTIDRYEGKTISYDVVQTGLNYRIDEIRSALGLVQLSKLDKNNQKRKNLVEYYTKTIHSKKALKDIIIPFTNLSSKSISSYHIFPILLPAKSDRIHIMEQLKQNGIQTSIHYPSYKDFTYYAKFAKKALVNADEISKRVLTLPLYPNMTFELVDKVMKSLTKTLT